MSERNAALANLRVVDFTWVLAGPYATRILADYGAEVIKIQPVADWGDGNISGYFNTWNRNKLSLSLNLNKPQGIKIIKRLIQLSDVVIENFSPRVMRNWGLDYATLVEIKPDLIMLSMSGLGQTGIWKDRIAFGATIHAFSGLTATTTFPGQPPMGLGYSYADHVAGLVATLSILEALEYRRRTGQGQYIDLSELEAVASLLGVAILDYTVNHRITSPVGNRPCYLAAAPHSIYRCRGEDRWCTLAVFNDTQWEAFCDVLGNPLWTKEERFATLSSRLDNLEELDRLVERWTLEHTPEEVMASLQQVGIACGVVQDASALSRDPQLKARGFFVEADHPIMGKTSFDGSPIKLSATPAQLSRAAPLLGQDNEYVLAELLGMSEEEVVRYTKKEVFG
jgi:crotonobetainyl-CoA:carnitine CoA-transferase CaiB-like acyl-CoA transferase